MKKEICIYIYTPHLEKLFPPIFNLSSKLNLPCHFWAQIFPALLYKWLHKVVRNYLKCSEQNTFVSLAWSQQILLDLQSLRKHSPWIWPLLLSKDLGEFGLLKVCSSYSDPKTHVCNSNGQPKFMQTVLLSVVSLYLDKLGQTPKGMKATYHITVLL